MKGQVISSCSSGHIAGDGGDQIDSPLHADKERVLILQLLYMYAEFVIVMTLSTAFWREALRV